MSLAHSRQNDTAGFTAWLRYAAVLVVLVCVGGQFTSAHFAFYAPLTLATALAMRLRREQFWALLALALASLLMPVLWGDSDAGLNRFLTAGCLVVIGGIRFSADRYALDSESLIDLTLVTPQDTIFGTDLSDHPATSGPDSIATQNVADIVNQLDHSGHFTPVQLDIVSREVHAVLLADGEIPESQSALAAGAEVGQYVLQGVIGRGGSGQVYAAMSKNGKGRVAIKVLRNRRFNERFQREMQLVQRLAHPNIVVAYEAETYHGLPYIVMELLSGPNLHSYISNHGTLTWQQSLAVIRQAASALDHAHLRRLIHRDIKPGNLLFDGPKRIKVSDLGLATIASVEEESDETEHPKTESDLVAGTLDFMAPEQARSLAAADERSDIYGLGATWFFLLTGRICLPGETRNEKLVNLIRTGDRIELPESVGPQSVRDIIDQMLAFDPNDRIQSMRELIDAMDTATVGAPIPTEGDTVNVLIVEDDSDDLQLTIELLKRQNKSVVIHQANTMANAIEQTRQADSFDVVLLDLGLPDSFGPETVQRMRAILPDTPIIVLTGNDDVVVGQQCLAVGADEFTCKNDLTSHLLERVIFITLSRCLRREAKL